MGQQHAWYEKQFESFERSLNGDSRTPVHKLRRSAITHFLSRGFPTTQEEEWRFTNVQPIASRTFIPSIGRPEARLTAGDIDRLAFPAVNRVVFVNGHVVPELSSTRLPQGVFAGSLAVARRNHASVIDRYLGASVRGTESAFTALNTSFLQDGLFVHVPDGVELEEPIVAVFIAAGASGGFAAHPRNLFVLDERASATVTEVYVTFGTSDYLTNAVTEVDLSPGARLEHHKVQSESRDAFHVGFTHVRQKTSSVFHSTSVTLGGSLVRNELISVLSGEWCECTMNGLSVGSGTQLLDNHTTIDHATPNGRSWEVYKAILDGSSKGIFNGKIFVRKDAQKTDAKQTNKTLLLSDSATIDTKPQLEIFADDVKCTHGATVGQLDEQQIFYLRSRGIGVDQARDLLTTAFGLEVIERVKNPSLRSYMERILRQRLHEERVRTAQ
ncbi:MAG: Fe-S cluster assembly protein SufD [Ignavibacteria bacterium GWA2_55_11]|nr:MAG: Fe-S cluster assembly protein SufD [Ignavibacteria bacterium GWA2_55_11]OGU44451.1 MAG: Fe-S cluster assembly protein SufD [Ignavibacteria bacterium GWC2_56_12]OGU68289.1 MAG: Fe-S cluster assembly protein SufD [Ignavibacteria bacterium RIFCSPHIGHO2_02_FULL_56_12]OGU72222.1 MAG: Fe-S cluster assembly protein SufD [Ignavibacteria bacterium RIFCSPLOWO2_02_FULL_55_14]OGU72262.1 MAG: Fe-S cluster assembly protein SufD [Ignavibacteria bacterium RIFCSPLOWO2_12_FULL_56_21]HAV22372.1 Fe-S clus